MFRENDYINFNAHLVLILLTPKSLKQRRCQQDLKSEHKDKNEMLLSILQTTLTILLGKKIIM